jgi:6-phosphogluconolactonase (cycloisomerase 2 family)
MNQIYVQTNDAQQNEIVAYSRADDGSLTRRGAYPTGGRGTGKPHLPSQSSVVASDGRLLVVNAGSGDVSLFAIDGSEPRLVHTAAAGDTPTSIAVRGEHVYVLANGDAAIHGFRIESDELVRLPGSTRQLSSAAADGAQVAFSPDGTTLVVTERGSNAISTFTVDERGYAYGPRTIPSAGATPYGFDFTATGALVVTEAFGGERGKAAASSYALTDAGVIEPVSGSVGDTRSEVCWAAATHDGRFVYVTNFGDGTISSYGIGGDGSIELVEPVAASTRLGEPGIRDEAITPDGRFLYAIDADAGRVHGWEISADGGLLPIGAFDGVPATVAGLATS